MRLEIKIDDQAQHIDHISKNSDITIKVRDGIIQIVNIGTIKKPSIML